MPSTRSNNDETSRLVAACQDAFHGSLPSDLVSPEFAPENFHDRDLLEELANLGKAILGDAIRAQSMLDSQVSNRLQSSLVKKRRGALREDFLKVSDVTAVLDRVLHESDGLTIHVSSRDEPELVSDEDEDGDQIAKQLESESPRTPAENGRPAARPLRSNGYVEPPSPELGSSPALRTARHKNIRPAAGRASFSRARGPRAASAASPVVLPPPRRSASKRSSAIVLESPHPRPPQPPLPQSSARHRGLSRVASSSMLDEGGYYGSRGGSSSPAGLASGGTGGGGSSWRGKKRKLDDAEEQLRRELLSMGAELQILGIRIQHGKSEVSHLAQRVLDLQREAVEIEEKGTSAREGLEPYAEAEAEANELHARLRAKHPVLVGGKALDALTLAAELAGSSVRWANDILDDLEDAREANHQALEETGDKLEREREDLARYMCDHDELEENIAQRREALEDIQKTRDERLMVDD
ncbi:hypothetical protein BX600DRAFT_555779 [Xylariales sp. PMI_506]|nr:hypothetical protein BX600DRAFT_555779 [Xylariales sp. PMI_506]